VEARGTERKERLPRVARVWIWFLLAFFFPPSSHKCLRVSRSLAGAGGSQDGLRSVVPWPSSSFCLPRLSASCAAQDSEEPGYWRRDPRFPRDSAPACNPQPRGAGDRASCFPPRVAREAGRRSRTPRAPGLSAPSQPRGRRVPGKASLKPRHLARPRRACGV
jgi:hypothetical protein